MRRAKRLGASVPRADDPNTWPIVWRVVIPAAGSYDHDSVFLETMDEAAARKMLRDWRRVGYPMRLERVSCGPLPKGYPSALKVYRTANPQNPGTKMRKVLGAWEVQK